MHLFSDSSPSVAEKRTFRPCHFVYHMGRCALPTGWGPENAPFMLSDGKDVMGLSRGPPANLVAVYLKLVLFGLHFLDDPHP